MMCLSPFPEAVAERVRVGVLSVAEVMAAQQTGPGGQVGGDVRGNDTAFVNLPDLCPRRRPDSTPAGGAWPSNLSPTREPFV